MSSILILGGTAWFGRVLAERAVAAGHSVTCVARGEAGEPPSGVEFVRADRSAPGAYREVDGRDWDLVVEISWQPRFVRAALRALAARARGWVLISSCSVYAGHDEPGADESAALLDPVVGDSDEVDVADYGGAKVACEQITTEATGGRAALLRAGLIGGDGDSSDRTGYWPGRCAKADGGPVLVPDRAESVQIVDVRDLADFTLLTGLSGRSGPVNAVGERCDFTQVLPWCRDAAVEAGYPEVEFVGRPGGWLLARGVRHWAGPRSLPLWLPDDHAGFAARSDRRALEWGLARRPLVETLRGALAYEIREGLDRERQAGLSRSEELALLRDRTRRSDPRGG